MCMKLVKSEAIIRKVIYLWACPCRFIIAAHDPNIVRGVRDLFFL